MGPTKKTDLLFPTDRNGSCELFLPHLLSQNQQLPYTRLSLLLTRTQLFSQTSWSTGTQEYTDYFNISAQTQMHWSTHTWHQDINNNKNLHVLFNVHRSKDTYWGGGGGNWPRRPRRLGTAARTMEVLTRCPLAIAAVTRIMSVVLLLSNKLKQKRSNFHSPAPPPCSWSLRSNFFLLVLLNVLRYRLRY